MCIVGPAPTIDTGNESANREQVEKIESHDVVVRLNKSLPISDEYKSFLGSRTDVLYSCLHPPSIGGYIDIDFLKKEIEWLVCPVPLKTPFNTDIVRFESRNKNQINFSVVDLEFFNKVEKEMRTRPNTGIMTILDILSCEVSSLYVTGMTFFKGGHLKNYRDHTPEQIKVLEVSYGTHDQKPQKDFMKKIVANDKRVSADAFFMEALND